MRDHDALVAFLTERGAKPFAWRGNHCVAFAAAAVKAQTGRNPMRGIDVRTELGAVRAIKRRGGMEAAVSARLRPIAPAMAKRGDIAGVHDARFGLALMVVEGDALIGPGGKRAPRAAMLRAWSAG